ncbi:MAG: RDD family protein [Verrucomicrobiota bacterium]
MNPYEAPKAEAKPLESASGFPPMAGAGRRFLNLIIDYAAQLAFAFLIFFGLGLGIGEGAIEWIDTVPDFVFGFALATIYYSLFEGITGRSVGKFVTGTRVVDANGDKIGFPGAFSRSLCRFIPFEPFSFLGTETRGWHDSITGTYVVICR